MIFRWRISDLTSSNKIKVSKKALFAFVFYLLLPTVAILMVIAAYPQLSKDRLLGILNRIIPISIALIVVSQLSVMYEKGNIRRFVLNEMYVVLVLLWLFAFLGGQPVIHQTWEQYRFSLHIWNYLALILFVTGMNVIYYIIEYQAYSGKDSVDENQDGEEKADKEFDARNGVIITTTQAQ